MNDHDNEIDALLRIWSVSPLEDHRRYRAALTALVAERDALWKERDELLKENVALRDRLKAKQDEVLDREFEMDTMRQQRDEARGQTWYLLYGGTSEDGMGTGHYIGRTTDKEVARKHHAELRKNPYSIGFVEIVTDTEKKRVSYYGRELQPEKEGGGA